MIFAWIASIIYGAIAVTGKLTGKHVIHNPWLFNFFWQLFILIGILPIALVHGVGMPTAWGNIFVAGIFYFSFNTSPLLW